MITYAKVLTALALIAGLASIHPRLRPAIYVAWACFAGVALCLVVEAMR